MKQKRILVFLDDERYQDDVYWIQYPEFNGLLTFRNSEQFKQFVDNLNDLSQYIFSFDHDIQDFDEDGQEITGKDCVNYLIDNIIDNGLHKQDLIAFSHSKNIIGKDNIDLYIQNFLDMDGQQ